MSSFSEQSEREDLLVYYRRSLKDHIQKLYPNHMPKESYVYILTNKNKTVLYTGVTNNLTRRLFEHKSNINQGFTSRYNVHELVYYEKYNNIQDAIYREKMIKKQPRLRKNVLISSVNPMWSDLSVGIL